MGQVSQHPEPQLCLLWELGSELLQRTTGVGQAPGKKYTFSWNARPQSGLRAPSLLMCPQSKCNRGGKSNYRSIHTLQVVTLFCRVAWESSAVRYVPSELSACVWCSLENIRWKEILGWLVLLGLLSLDSSCLRPSLALNVLNAPTSCSLSMSLPPPSGESLNISPEQHLTSSSLYTSFTIRCQDVLYWGINATFQRGSI